jgi:pseudouridine-5'-phosphate glycosidase/pseudouridine kinase
VLKHFPSVVLDDSKIANVTGAGDTLVGALCAGLVRNPYALQDPSCCDELILFAQEAAVLTLQNERAVSPQIRDLTLPKAIFEARGSR